MWRAGACCHCNNWFGGKLRCVCITTDCECPQFTSFWHIFAYPAFEVITQATSALLNLTDIALYNYVKQFARCIFCYDRVIRVTQPKSTSACHIRNFSASPPSELITSHFTLPFSHPRNNCHAPTHPYRHPRFPYLHLSTSPSTPSPLISSYFNPPAPMHNLPSQAQQPALHCSHQLSPFSILPSLRFARRAAQKKPFCIHHSLCRPPQ